jgi:hypothetical protein
MHHKDGNIGKPYTNASIYALNINALRRVQRSINFPPRDDRLIAAAKTRRIGAKVGMTRKIKYAKFRLENAG